MTGARPVGLNVLPEPRRTLDWVNLERHAQRATLAARAIRNRNGERKQAARSLMFRVAARMTPVVGVDCGDLRYLVSTRDISGVGFYVFVSEAPLEEAGMRRALAQLAARTSVSSLAGLTVLEIGANVGTESVAMIVRHGAARVVAIEADAENVRLLRANVALNGLEDRVAVHHLALSDFDGTIELERSDDNWGDHRVRVAAPVGQAVAGETARDVVPVPSRRLDTLVADGAVELDQVGLVWLDVQGHEAHVLAGADGLFAAGIPVVTEYWPYGLRRAGSLDRFHALVAEHFAEVVVLEDDDAHAPEVLPAARISELARRYTSFSEVTNLLLVPRV